MAFITPFSEKPVFHALGKVPMPAPERLLPPKDAPPPSALGKIQASPAAFTASRQLIVTKPPTAIQPLIVPVVSPAAKQASQAEKNVALGAKLAAGIAARNIVLPTSTQPATAPVSVSPAAEAASAAVFTPPPDVTAKAPEAFAWPSEGSSALPSNLPGESSTPTREEYTLAEKGLIQTKAASTATAIQVAHQSLWDRFLSFLGLTRKSKVAPPAQVGSEMVMTAKSVKAAAESVVRRVRSGDQNAMALMAMVRDNAAAGKPQAQMTLRYMRMYVDSHPIDGNATMGSEYDTAISLELGE